MSSKAENQPKNILQPTHNWQIFFRNPFLLKVVAWLSSLSVILASGGIWTEAQAKSSVSNNTPIAGVTVGLESASDLKQPIAKIPATPNIQTNNTTKEIPNTSATPVVTNRVVQRKHTDILKADHFVVGVIEPNQNNRLRPYTPSGQERAVVPQPASCVSISSETQLVTAGCSQVQPRQKRSQISTSVPLATISPKTSANSFGVREIAIAPTQNNQQKPPSAVTVVPRPIPVYRPLRPNNSQDANVTIKPLPLKRDRDPNIKITPLPINNQPATIANTVVPQVTKVTMDTDSKPVVPPTYNQSKTISSKPVVPPTALPKINEFKTVPTVPPLPVIETATTKTPDSYNYSVVTSTATPGVDNNALVDISNGGMIYPLSVPVPMTSGFGWRVHPITGGRRFHAGIDLGAPYGTPVVAAGTGKVVSADWMGGYGKTIVIQHNDRQQTLYAHLADIFVQPGQVIERGTVIGRVGSTGNSTGPHLHFETKVANGDGWVAVDPEADVKYALANLRRSIALSPNNNRSKVN